MRIRPSFERIALRSATVALLAAVVLILLLTLSPHDAPNQLRLRTREEVDRGLHEALPPLEGVPGSGPFDIAYLARSPAFTPPKTDAIFDEIRERFIDENPLV